MIIGSDQKWTLAAGNEFLERLLDEYRKSFDIVRDYEIGGIKASAYGFFSTISEKYVLSPKANLWSVHGFEHILFLPCDEITIKELEDLKALMALHMAPQLVCKGRKYPEKDHMYSYLTVALLCEQAPDEETVKCLERFRFEKNYLATIRGYAEGHLILMDLSSGRAYTNKAARHLKDYYERIFRGCFR